MGQRDTAAEMVPYDDYYCYEGASLVANRSFRELERNSDTSTKPGSISFRTMIREDQLQQDGAADEIGFSSRSGAHIGSPSPAGSSPSAAMPMLPVKEIPRY
nr:unknown [Zea mays]